MASLKELDESLGKLERILTDTLADVIAARDLKNYKLKSSVLQALQLRLLEAARVIPFDVDHH